MKALLCFLGFSLIVSLGYSADRTWDPSNNSTDWCDNSNWVEGDVPTNADKAIIAACTEGLNCPHITVTDCGTAAIVKEIVIQDNATLTVAATLKGDPGRNIEIQGGTLKVLTGAIISDFKDFKFKTNNDGVYYQNGGSVTLEDDFKVESDNNSLTIVDGDFTLGKSFELKGDGNDISITGGNISFQYVKTYGGGGIEGCGTSACSNPSDGQNNDFSITGAGVTLKVTGIDLGTGGLAEALENTITIGSDISYDPSSPANPLGEDSVFGVDALDGNVSISSVILPVKIILFEAQEDLNQSIRLNWSTASERDNDGFYVERSLDGDEFRSIAFIDGNGTTNNINNYQYTDHYFTSHTYYRLKQVDFDGVFEYSEIISVTSSNSSFNIYPNPIIGNQNITITGRFMNSISMSLLSLEGRVLVNETGKLDQVSSLINKELGNLKEGIYIIRIEDNQRISNLRLVKK
ncbi:MAG: T9SS type A sorting domain-containing protein [Reichenbachiella sp.]